jgi:hypothetical protein
MYEEEAKRRRAERLRDEIARLREGEPRKPSSPREFVEQEGRRGEEQAEQEAGNESDESPPD